LKQSLCPYFDRAFSALLEDMAERGLLEDTLVVCMGEFGRTPKLGQVVSGAGATANGRDHWPFCYSVMFAGAGVPGGAVLGASDRQGAYPSLDPVSPADVAATVYEALGIGAQTEIHDGQGRPHNLVRGAAIRKLIG
jgi:arylsulfatase A-like enzyme